MNILAEDLRETLIVILAARDGSPVTVNTLSKRFKIGAPALREILMDMGPTHKVRETKVGRHVAFLLPTEEMMRKEQAEADKVVVNSFRPLRRRDDHLAAVERAFASKLK